MLPCIIALAGARGSLDLSEREAPLKVFSEPLSSSSLRPNQVQSRTLSIGKVECGFLRKESANTPSHLRPHL